MSDEKKLKKKAFDPRTAFGLPAIDIKPSNKGTVGPKEQTLKFDSSVKRGGKEGVTIGSAKPRKSFTRGTGNITARRRRTGSR